MQKFKYLGFTLDRKSSYGEHIRELRRRGGDSGKESVGFRRRVMQK